MRKVRCSSYRTVLSDPTDWNSRVSVRCRRPAPNPPPHRGAMERGGIRVGVKWDAHHTVVRWSTNGAVDPEEEHGMEALRRALAAFWRGFVARMKGADLEQVGDQLADVAADAADAAVDAVIGRAFDELRDVVTCIQSLNDDERAALQQAIDGVQAAITSAYGDGA